MWYPDNKPELESFIENSFKEKPKIRSKKISGLIVPHAGYEYSGGVAGKAFSLLKNKKLSKAIIIGPSHYINLEGAATSSEKYYKTPLGEIKIGEINLQKTNIENEHSIKNEIPFLQKLGITEIIPVMVGKIDEETGKELARKISKIDAVYIFSTDLSHFMPYEEGVKKDRESIKIIENLDINNFKNLDACGYYPLIILMHLCKIKKLKPKLIEYKNSGDVTGDKSSVVGYAGFCF